MVRGSGSAAVADVDVLGDRWIPRPMHRTSSTTGRAGAMLWISRDPPMGCADLPLIGKDEHHRSEEVRMVAADVRICRF